MALTTIAVQEIHCASCEHTIRSALERLDGVRSVQPDAVHKEVRVAYDQTKIDEGGLRRRLAELGYEPVG
ncbi:MAG: heavy-metal-associated domain-containing protein [Acidimicrobiales bacterium]